MRICSIFSLLIHIGFQPPAPNVCVRSGTGRNVYFSIWFWFLFFLFPVYLQECLQYSRRGAWVGGFRWNFICCSGEYLHEYARILIWFSNMLWSYIYNICVYTNIYKYITTFIAEVNICLSVCACVCVCERERERECESVCVYLCVLTCIYL